MAKHLSDLQCKKAKPDPSKRVELHDGKVPGLSLRITPTGVKSWSFIYRLEGQRTRITLGRYPALSLDAARQMANDAQGRVYQGEAPQQAMRGLRGERTLDERFEDFLVFYRNSGKRSAGELERNIKKHILPKLAKRVPRTVVKRDLQTILLTFENQPALYSVLRAYLSIFFTWLAEHDHVDGNPVSGIGRRKVASREKVLTDDELKAIWNGCLKVGWPWGHFYRLLMLLGQRRGEVAAMEPALVGTNSGIWEIPDWVSKNGLPHLVPLPAAALEIIRAMPVIVDENGNRSLWLFPAATKISNRISTFSEGKKLIDKASGVTGWRVHDLRRTAATGMAGLGVQTEVIEAVLNHISGKRAGVAGVYNRFTYLPQKTEALTAWATHLRGLVSPVS